MSEEIYNLIINKFLYFSQNSEKKKNEIKDNLAHARIEDDQPSALGFSFTHAHLK